MFALPDEANKKKDPDNARDFIVWPENWPALALFLACRTQWHYAPMGQRIGLDYCQVEAAMNMQGKTWTERPTLFDELQLIEYGALGLIKNMPE